MAMKQQLGIAVLTLVSFIQPVMAQGQTVNTVPTAALVPAATSTSNWKQEPEGFAGVRFGTSSEETIARLSLSCPDLAKTSVCTKEKYYITDDFHVEATFF